MWQIWETYFNTLWIWWDVTEIVPLATMLWLLGRPRNEGEETGTE